MSQNIEKIVKRNGETVDFETSKINTAMRKAFASCDKDVSDQQLDAMTAQVLQELEARFIEQTPSVEATQDIVEMVIMQNGFFEVAKSYILYRHEQFVERQKEHQEVLNKIQEKSLTIVKRSGEKATFSLEKLIKSIRWAAKDMEEIIDVEGIATKCQDNLYDGIETSQISRAVILAARTYIEIDPAYSLFAARLLGDTIYKTTIGNENYTPQNRDQLAREAFISNLKKAVEIDRLDPKILDFDMNKITAAIDFERDDLFRYLGLQTLADRYFIRNPYTKQVLEYPQAFWMRVSMGLAFNEENKEEAAIKFYNLISNLYFVPSTPTLFHSGTQHPQLSSCYLTTVKDSLDHIFKCIGDNAQLSKWSGGLGNDWTSIRGTGSLIKGTGVQSQGVVPFLKIANDTTVAINRSGRRRGATCAYLEAWHYDFEEFLELRRNTGDERRRTHDMNTASWIPDLFMKRVQEDGQWTLFSPDETPDLHEIYGSAFEAQYEKYEQMIETGEIQVFKKIKARDLWRKMLSMLFETGHPWITFKDPCNVRSPQDHCGVVHSSNLCTEITLNTSADETAVCNLGSVNLKAHIKDGKFDYERLESTVKTAMRMLDNVIDLNFYPTKEAENSNMKHRPVGLGVMGFQDALYLLNIKFDSQEAIEFADENMEFVAYHAISASSDLAHERGVYESFKGSKWDRGIMPLDTLDLLEKERNRKIDVSRSSKMDWQSLREKIKLQGMRNSNCMAIAPTATISNIAGCFPTIEPIYKNMYVKSNMSGEFTITNSYLIEELKKLNLWNSEMRTLIKEHDGSIAEIASIPQAVRDMYKEVFDISEERLIDITAHRGKWVDQSQSFNIFIKGTSGKKLMDTYMLAWEKGLKTTYYLRSLAATSIEKSTTRINKSSIDTSDKRTHAGVAETPTAESKLCKIADPDCEACQ
jgi:ribonucleoside-diphosphate reductase alpha chain